MMSKSATISILQMRTLTYLLLFIGVLSRIWHYLAHTSLWLDELALARNIVDRNWYELLVLPLDYDQVAPVGFLIVEKIAITLLGTEDWALRLFPTLCSITTLFLIWRVAKFFLPETIIPLIVGLLALSPRVIDLSSNVKQYSSDLMLALLLLYLSLHLLQKYPKPIEYIVAALVGIISVLISQSAIFMMAGLGLALGINGYKNRSYHLVPLLILGTVWAVAAGIGAFFTLNRVTSETHEYLNIYWRDGFMPLPWQSISDIVWLGERMERFFSRNLDYSLPWLFAGLTFLGLIGLWRYKRESALLLFGPLLITVLLSIAGHYPFQHRAIFFLTPIFLIAIGSAIEWLQESPLRTSFVLLILTIPLYNFSQDLPPYPTEETKPLLAKIQTNWQAGDKMYVYYGAAQAVRYYGENFGLTETEYHIGGCYRGQNRAYLQEIDRFRGESRVWIFFAHSLSRYKEQETILAYLNEIGIERMALVSDHKGTSTYLFDLSNIPRLLKTSTQNFSIPGQSVLEAGLGCQNGPQSQWEPKLVDWSQKEFKNPRLKIVK